MDLGAEIPGAVDLLGLKVGVALGREGAAVQLAYHHLLLDQLLHSLCQQVGVEAVPGATQNA